MSAPQARAGQAIADMIGHVLRAHVDHSAPITEGLRVQAREAFLEGLEHHSAGVVGPLVDKMREGGDIAPELQKLLDAVAAPTAQFGGLLQQFFVFGVMFSLASQLLAPITQVVANEVWSLHPDRPLAPADLADMVVRGLLAQPDAETAARMSGINGPDFDLMVKATGEPPAPEMLFEMIRRGVIGDDLLNRGIRQGRTKDEWIPYLDKMRYVLPSPADLVRAAVQAQMPYELAKRWAITAGLMPEGDTQGNPDWFDMLYNTAGRPPGPVELARAANRGLIPWTGRGPEVLSFEQGVSESDIKDKWTSTLQTLAEYVPPPREIGTLLQHGAITEAQATHYYEMLGVPPELAAAFTFQALQQQVAQDKLLAKGEVLTSYLDGFADRETTLAALDALGYRGQVAEFLLKVTDYKRAQRVVTQAISRIGKALEVHAISAAQAEQDLTTLGVPESQREVITAEWAAAQATYVTPLTRGTVTSAFYYGVMDQAEAMAKLQQLGYSAYDAWVELSTRVHGALPGKPPEA